jgi:hypothetical protein
MDPNGLLVIRPISAVDSASDFYIQGLQKDIGRPRVRLPHGVFVRQALLAQMVEHLLCKLKVLGSIPKDGILQEALSFRYLAS